jgi:hypothetical protein
MNDTTLLASKCDVNELFSYVSKEFRKLFFYFVLHKLVILFASTPEGP